MPRQWVSWMTAANCSTLLKSFGPSQGPLEGGGVLLESFDPKHSFFYLFKVFIQDLHLV